MVRSWIIGSGEDCDLVVDSSTVSGRHCRLTREADGFVLEDLGSTNGTYVNGARIARRTRVTPADAVTLGLTAALPWPSEELPEGKGVLRIGREPDNDFVVDLPIVSGHHARILWDGGAGGAIIEDLGSSNGTALGSPDRKISRSALTLTDTVYLGTHPVPAAELLARMSPAAVPTLAFRGRQMMVGRDPSCDRVLDFPMVSGRHARLARVGGRILVEDMDSANGTFVNGRRIDRTVAVKPGDLIGLGSYTLLLEDAESDTEGDSTLEEVGTVEGAKFPTLTLTLTAVEIPPPADQGGAAAPAGDATGTASVSPSPSVTATSTSASAPASWWDDLPAAFARVLGHPWRLLALLAPAPLAAGLIVVALGVGSRTPPTAEDWSAVSESIASGLFWLGFTAVAIGLADAVLGVALEGTIRPAGRKPRGIALFVARSAVLSVLCVAQCSLALAIVHRGMGLRGPGLAMLAFLSLASVVGLMLGLAVVAPARRPAFALAALPPALLLLWLLGGHWRPLPEVDPPIRMAASVLPTRWAFEGLLLLESGRDPRGEPGGDPPRARDLAAVYFPEETERMGVRAGTIALGAMLIGLAAGAAFLSEGRDGG